MTRKQRAAKLAKRREAQKGHRGTTRREKHGKNVIEVPRGPRHSKSFHASDPYRHGEQLRRAEQIISFCDSIGFNPTEGQSKYLRDLFNRGQLGQDIIRSMASQSRFARIEIASGMPQPSGGPPAPVMHTDEVELLDEDRLRETVLGTPTEEEWAELEAEAKAKKKGARGYVKVMKDAGFLLGKGEDPKDRKSWVKA